MKIKSGNGQLNIGSLQKGLVGHWTMSQDSLKGSLLADKTPYENDGTIHGATFATDRKGQPNKAMSFNGVDDYIDCGNDKSLGIKDKLTLSAWVKIENLTSGDSTKRIIDKATGANGLGGYTLAHRTNNGGELFLAINGVYQSVSMKQEDEWIYLTSIVDGANWKIYLNGKIILSVLKKKDLIATEASLRLGQANTFTSRHKGKIDDVRIYNRALSEEEITTLYESYNPSLHIDSLQKGLVAHWTMSEDSLQSATVLADKTPYENNGTINGATFTTDRMGQANKAMSFDGNDYIDCGNLGIISDNFTFSAWFKTSSKETYNPIIMIDGNTTGNPQLRIIGNGKVQFRFYNGNNLESSIAYNNNQWHFAVGGVSDGKQILYVDGISQGTLTPNRTLNWTGNTKIGLYSFTTPASCFSGLIDDVRIYNRALSEEEITKLYESYNK